VFRESLKSREALIIVYDEFRGRYIEALIAYREGGGLEKLKAAFRECQKRYSETVDYFYKERALHKKKDGADD